MRKEYMKPAIDMAAIASEQTLLVGTNKNNWAEAKENSFDEEEDTALDRIKLNSLIYGRMKRNNQ